MKERNDLPRLFGQLKRSAYRGATIPRTFVREGQVKTLRQPVPNSGFHGRSSIAPLGAAPAPIRFYADLK
jgi:hypothetical protein